MEFTFAAEEERKMKIRHRAIYQKLILYQPFSLHRFPQLILSTNYCAALRTHFVNA